MGFFNKTPVICPICGRDCAAAGGKKQLKDATVCWSCIMRAGYNPRDASKLSLTDIRPKAAAIHQALQATKDMPVSLQLQDLCIDADGKQWYCNAGLYNGSGMRDPETIGVYPLGDLQVAWVESYTVDSVNTKTTNNGIKRAIVGGVLAGSAGAMIGAVTATQSTTGYTTSTEHFHVHLKFKKNPSQDYWIYLKDANEVNLLLQYVSQATQQGAASEKAADPAEELRKYKALLDDGIITQQDFDAKKKQLLGL